jgi:23S rRNA (cytidine1920-2'-O)/16S rRNA (cytidine1409-2'-O)-methyltransferase
VENKTLRADIHLSRLEGCSRQFAKNLISQGLVSVNGRILSKPSENLPAGSVLTVKPYEKKFVGRGGLKLEEALDHFSLDPSGLTCADIGASTGGFTDCLLQRGAKKIYAIDNGKGQLAASLQADPRVASLEKTNIRSLKWQDLGERIPFATADISFMSLTLALPGIKRLLEPDGLALCLVKPQFEAGRKAVGKSGVVRDVKIRTKAALKVIDFARSIGFEMLGEADSSIHGGDGNIERFILLKNKLPLAADSDSTRAWL